MPETSGEIEKELKTIFANNNVKYVVHSYLLNVVVRPLVAASVHVTFFIRNFQILVLMGGKSFQYFTPIRDLL